MSNKETEHIEVLYHQPGHLKGVVRIEEVEDYIFTGGKDGRICIWDSNLNEEIGCIYAHKFSINDIQKLNDEEILVTASNALELKLWSLKDFSLIFSKRAHSSAIIGAKPWKNYVISASRDHMLKKWKFKNGKLLEEIRIKIPGMERFFLCDDLIIITDQYGLISILKAEDFSKFKHNAIVKKKLIRAIKKASKYIKDFANQDPHTILFNMARRYGIPSTVCTTNDDFFILGHQFGLVSFWRKDNGKLSEIFFLHSKHITGVEFHENKLITISLDSTVVISDIETGSPIKVLKLPSRPLSLKQSTDGLLIIGTESGEIVSLNHKLEIIKTLPKIIPISGSCVAPDFLAVAFSNGEIQLLDNTDLKNVIKRKIHNKTPLSINYYENRLITIGEDKQIYFLDKNLNVTKTIQLSVKPVKPMQARHYITINSNHVLDLNKDEIIRGEISKETRKELEDEDFPKHIYQNGDLSILINQQGLNETENSKLLEFYSREVLQSFRRLMEASRNAEYKKVTEFTVLRSEN
ncbi:MAG: hypothetical protein H7641_14620 [Candidatus Heimdallarchaeota archaeon]|nr:hypothetical protein [Candidatus Heimdallarchaeota archaeon]MCK4878795.1 hypothetical protein [Candidatus Heimdallarchaeota archaeon]